MRFVVPTWDRLDHSSGSLVESWLLMTTLLYWWDPALLSGLPEAKEDWPSR